MQLDTPSNFVTSQRKGTGRRGGANDVCGFGDGLEDQGCLQVQLWTYRINVLWQILGRHRSKETQHTDTGYLAAANLLRN
jgi:hypothetical protein